MVNVEWKWKGGLVHVSIWQWEQMQRIFIIIIALLHYAYFCFVSWCVHVLIHLLYFFIEIN